MKTLIKGIIDILVSPYIVLGSYSCIIIMYYCGALYRDLLSVTHLFSLMVFAFIVVFAVLHGIFFTILSKHTEHYVLESVIIACSFYSVLTRPQFFLTEIFLGFVLVVLTVFPIVVYLVIRCGDKRRLEKMSIAFAKDVYVILVKVITAAAVLYLVSVFVVVSRKEDSVSPASMTTELREDYKVLTNLKDWRNLSEKQRVKILKTVIKIESANLGLESCPALRIMEMEDEEYDSVNGYYRERKNTICIKKWYLLNGKAEDVIKTAAHETRHAYQYSVLSALRGYVDISATQDQGMLLDLTHVKVIDHEFHNYSDGKDGINKYYFQECEVDARMYAEAVVDRYKEYYSE